MFGRRWTEGVGDLGNWAIFMDVICVSSLIAKRYAGDKTEHDESYIF